jgi:hypothetical protein
MLTTRLAVITFLATLLISAPSFSDEIRGVIDRVDPGKQELSIAVRGRGPRGRVLSFKLAKDTQVHAGRQSAQLSDLHPGDRARVYFENRDGERVAVDVSIRGLLLRSVGPIVGGPIEKSEELPTPTPVSADPNTVSGVLQRVALTDREIVIIGPGAKGEPELETTLTVSEETRITKDGKPIKLEGLKEGDRVVAHFQKHDDRMAADSITVGGRASQAASAAAPNDRIERLRQVLRLADYFLQQLAEQRGK